MRNLKANELLASVGNSTTTIYTDNQKVVNYIRRVCSYTIPNKHFNKLVQQGKWDGVYYLAKKSAVGVDIPTGLLGRVAEALKTKGGILVLDDQRVRPEFVAHGLEWNENKKERYYQDDATNACLEATRGMVAVATGGGKMLNAVLLYYKTGLKTLLIVTSREAVKDSAREFRELLPGVDVVEWDGKTTAPGDVTISTINAFHSRFRKKKPVLNQVLAQTQLLIMDEVHAVGGSEYYGIAQQCSAYYKFGQSGTPFRPDKKDIYLEAATGDIIYTKDSQELVEEGYLSKSKIVFLETDGPTHIPHYDLPKLTPQAFYDATIVYNEPRNLLVKRLSELLQNRRTLYVVRKIEHGEVLSDLLGIPFLHGGIKKKERDATQAALQSGELHSLIVSVIYDQSVNIPDMEAMVDCSGESPEIKVIQRLGRIIRLAEGKEFALSVAFMDSWDADTKKHSKKRMGYLKKHGHAPEVMSMEDFEYEFTTYFIGRR